jgi:hypothetical protein
VSRFFEPVPVIGGQHPRQFCIRDGERRRLCEDLGLSWDQADRLCHVLEGVRERAQRELRLPDPPPEQRAA